MIRLAPLRVSKIIKFLLPFLPFLCCASFSHPLLFSQWVDYFKQVVKQQEFKLEGVDMLISCCRVNRHRFIVYFQINE